MQPVGRKYSVKLENFIRSEYGILIAHSSDLFDFSTSHQTQIDVKNILESIVTLF